MSIKYDNVHIYTTKDHHKKLPVNPNNGGVEAQAKPRAP